MLAHMADKNFLFGYGKGWEVVFPSLSSEVDHDGIWFVIVLKDLLLTVAGGEDIVLFIYIVVKFRDTASSWIPGIGCVWRSPTIAIDLAETGSVHQGTSE